MPFGLGYFGGRFVQDNFEHRTVFKRTFSVDIDNEEYKFIVRFVYPYKLK